MKPFVLPIGSDRRLVTVANPGFRTGQQAARVRRLLETGRVAFACCDPFSVSRYEPRPRRPRTFAFVFYDRNDTLTIARIAPTGRIVREVVA